ncbi:MAG TPA: type II toxin-antitoxin system RelE/ParE family toxin [Tepidisphaeraceae bacterium]|jgi:phage-related protein
MGLEELKPLIWIASSHSDLCDLPKDVQSDFGFALYLAQQGKQHRSVKVLQGFGGAGVLEIIENDDGGTYRAVYTIKLAGVVYVLHVFQKKSAKGIRTPKKEIDLIHRRLKDAGDHHRKRQNEKKN